jgi:hypothetical protein
MTNSRDIFKRFATGCTLTFDISASDTASHSEAYPSKDLALMPSDESQEQDALKLNLQVRQLTLPKDATLRVLRDTDPMATAHRALVEERIWELEKRYLQGSGDD